jgi:hypothetical protein
LESVDRKDEERHGKEVLIKEAKLPGVETIAYILPKNCTLQ